MSLPGSLSVAVATTPPGARAVTALFAAVAEAVVERLGKGENRPELAAIADMTTVADEVCLMNPSLLVPAGSLTVKGGGSTDGPREVISCAGTLLFAIVVAVS